MQYFDCDKIQYEGPDSKNPLAFKHYHADEAIAGKTMKEHLRFAGAYWHVMRNDLSDPFGAGTALMPWDDGSDSVENALTRVDVFFEFLDKMGIEYYCWHDRDIAPELNDLYGVSFLSPAFRAGCGNFSRRQRLCLRRCPGEEST